MRKIQDRGRHRSCSVNKDILESFAKFTGKYMRQGLFFNKVPGLKTTASVREKHGNY